jgi:hypothetical protein
VCEFLSMGGRRENVRVRKRERGVNGRGGDEGLALQKEEEER